MVQEASETREEEKKELEEEPVIEEPKKESAWKIREPLKSFWGGLKTGYEQMMEAKRLKEDKNRIALNIHEVDSESPDEDYNEAS